MKDFSDFRKRVIENSDTINQKVSEKISATMEGMEFEDIHDEANFSQRLVAYQCTLAVLEAYHEWLNSDG